MDTLLSDPENAILLAAVAEIGGKGGGEEKVDDEDAKLTCGLR